MGIKNKHRNVDILIIKSFESLPTVFSMPPVVVAETYIETERLP